MSGWVIALRRLRAPSFEKATRARALRSSAPSAPTIPPPNASTSARSPTVPGATTSRATSSASITGTPRARRRAATVLLPDAIPPVSPKRCTRRRGIYTFVVGTMRESSVRPGRLSRRRVVHVGLAFAALAAAAVAALRATGYGTVPPRPLLAFSPWQYAVVKHAARRIAAPDRDDASIPSTDDLDVATFVDAWVARMPARVRRDLGRFL